MKKFKDFLIEDKNVYSDKEAHKKFIFGHCRSFAHALHSQIGGELRALHKNNKELHVYVHKDGKDYDVGGQRDKVHMIKDIDGGFQSIDKWSDHSADHSKMKTNNKMIENAHKYINANQHKFRQK